MLVKEQYQAYLAQGENLAAAGDLAAAISIWEQARKHRANDQSLQDKINQANARLHQLEQQQTELDQLWARADRARKEKQWQQALKLLREIQSRDWQCPVPDPAAAIQEIQALLSQQQNNQQLLQQLRLVKAALEKYQIDKARELLSQYHPEQLSGDVKELWQQYNDRCLRAAARKNTLRKIIIASFVLLAVLLNWMLWSTESVVDRVTRLQQNLVTAVEQQDWDQAHEYYRQIHRLVPEKRREQLLAYLTTEQKFASIREQALKLKSRSEWQRLSELLPQLARLKPENQEVKNLQIDSARWQQRQQEQAARKLARIETYRKQLAQEQQALAELWPRYRQQEQPEINGEELLRRLNDYQIRLEKQIATIRQTPSASADIPLPDATFLAQINASRNKIAAAVAAMGNSNKKRLQRYLADLARQLLLWHKQRRQLRKQIESLEKRFPPGQGYQAVPELVREVYRQLTEAQQQLRILIAAGNQLLQKGQQARYIEFIASARRSSNDELQQKVPASLQALEQIQKANQKLWVKYQRNNGIKILGEWYADYLKSLHRYQSIMSQAGHYSEDRSMRDYVAKLQDKIIAAQDYPRQAAKIDARLQQLQARE